MPSSVEGGDTERLDTWEPYPQGAYNLFIEIACTKWCYSKINHFDHWYQAYRKVEQISMMSETVKFKSL